MKIFPRSVFLCFSFLFIFITGPTLAAIELAIEANPGPVQPNESVNVQIIVGNSGNTLSGSVVLQMIYPANLNTVTDGSFIDGGVCAGVSCSTNEIVTWQLGLIQPGLSQTVSLPPVVTNGTANGTIIPFVVEVFENAIKVGESSRNVVEWNLNTLSAYTGAEQKVTVSVNNEVVAGSLLEVDNVEIGGTVNFLPV